VGLRLELCENTLAAAFAASLFLIPLQYAVGAARARRLSAALSSGAQT